MYMQTLKKKISLLPNWKDNNYEGYSTYVSQVSSLNKTLASLMISPDLEVVSLDMTVEVVVKEKTKIEKVGLSDDFWLQVALEQYE